MLNRDPTQPSLAHPELCAAIRRQSLLPINLIFNTTSDTQDLIESVSVFPGVSFVPRIGETIEIQDGKQFQVTSVIHKVATIGQLPEGITLFGIVANVCAVRRAEADEKTSLSSHVPPE